MVHDNNNIVFHVLSFGNIELHIRVAFECVSVVDLIWQLFTCFIGFILFTLCKKQFDAVWFLDTRTR